MFDEEKDSQIDRELLGYDIFRVAYFFEPRLAQGQLQTFNHLRFFFVPLP